MANFEKYNKDISIKIIRHNSRENETYKNQDVQTELSYRNIEIINKGFDGYKKRLEQLYVYNRADVNTLCSWVVSMPKTTVVQGYTVDCDDYKNGVEWDKSITKSICTQISNFLIERYGTDNCIQSVFHADEKGQGHLHFTFIPVTEDNRKHKDSGLKVCADKVVNRKDLQSFHSDLKNYLNSKFRIPLGDLFYTGITNANGGNLSVEQLKEIDKLKQENQMLREKLAKYEHSISVENKKNVEFEF